MPNCLGTLHIWCNFMCCQKLGYHNEGGMEKIFIKSRISKFKRTLLITARQYGEVVLPDSCTGQSPGTLARKLSRCKEGMAHFLPSGYKFC